MLILELDSPTAALDNSGGKGANLARLARADLPVPPGFILTTEAYQTFVEANDLEDQIHAEVGAVNIDSEPFAFERVSEAIRARFAGGSMPLVLEAALRERQLSLEAVPLAVRSSATAEDLPHASFAGQQDTFLNVIGYESLRSAVIRCWSSLWTARAIAYRTRNRIPHASVSIAVVVQVLVQSESSGVLFTANPLTGVRRESVIDATLGLGEALVSGMVEPDHIVVDAAQGKITEMRIGRKDRILQSASGGGLVEISNPDEQHPALSEEAALDLALLGQRVQQVFGSPQDIEWARAAGRTFVLQSRPITSLFPLPPGPEVPLKAYFSFGAVQGMLDPMTPLGRDVIGLIFAGGATLFDYHLTHETQGVIVSAGERLWANFTPAVRNKKGRRIVIGASSLVEPGTRSIFETLIQDPRLQPERAGFRLSTLRRMLMFGLRILPRVMRNLMFPDRSRLRTVRAAERSLALFASHARAIGGDPGFRFQRRVELVGRFTEAFPVVLPTLGTGLASGLLAYRLAGRLATRSGVPAERVLALARGLPHNVTTEMDLALWETANAIKGDEESAEAFQTLDAGRLAVRYRDERLPARAQSALDGFLGRYGMRGVGEIDFGRRRWSDDPVSVIHTLKSYLQIPESLAPDSVFRRGALEAEKVEEEIARKIRQRHGGRLLSFAFKALVRRFRSLAGLRESPKFHIIRMMGVVRTGLQASAIDLVNAGELEERDDIFFLTYNELREAAAHRQSLQALWEEIRARKEEYTREQLRRQIPRVLLSDGHAFYEGLIGQGDPEDGRRLTGSPVSPGVAEGRVRVVFDPGAASLQPGEILVCPGTDPAWTPLFLTAGGLVMEVGGMMTHGSVVAREYGIPAVVGVHGATRRLKTGVHVRIDGGAGTIEILEDQEAISPTETSAAATPAS